MNEIIAFIPGEPRGKGRPRFAGHAYTPRETAAAEEALAFRVRAAAGPDRTHWLHPWAVHVHIQFSRANRPDVDNVAKLVLDSLNKVIWKDDRQVVRLMVSDEHVPASRAGLLLWLQPVLEEVTPTWVVDARMTMLRAGRGGA